MQHGQCNHWRRFGGFAPTHHGGMFHETYPGEKRSVLEPVLKAYSEELGMI